MSKKGKAIFWTIMGLICGVLIYAIVQVALKEPEYLAAKATYKEAVKTYVTEREDENPKEAPQTVATPQEPQAVVAPIEVDFDSLQAINPDIIGWIYCEDTTINHPILLGDTNADYIHHMYTGEYNYAGSIFMDYRNTGFDDENIIIYGHNMSSHEMFHYLPNYLKQDFMNEHPIIYILTPGKDYALEVFASLVTSYSSPLCLYQAVSNELERWQPKLDTILNETRAQMDVDVSEGDRLVMLSTCCYEFENARCVVFGKLSETMPLSTDAE